MDKHYDVKNFFHNTVILGRPDVANFPNIIKIAISLIKTIFKNLEIFKKLQIKY